jgi:hypothetical protein
VAPWLACVFVRPAAGDAPGEGMWMAGAAVADGAGAAVEDAGGGE